MKDRLFYPLALATALVIISAAIAPGLGALPTGSISGGGTDYSEIIVEGDDLNRIIGGGESKIELLNDGAKRALRIEVRAGTLPDAPELGPHFRLAADIENVFSGKTVEIIMRVKPSSRYGAMRFVANYSTGKNGESGWTEFALKPEYDDYTLIYDVPLRGAEQGVDYLAIRPVTPEKTRAIEIERITLRPAADP